MSAQFSGVYWQNSWVNFWLIFTIIYDDGGIAAKAKTNAYIIDGMLSPLTNSCIKSIKMGKLFPKEKLPNNGALQRLNRTLCSLHSALFCFVACFFSAVVIDISIIKFFIELSSHLLFYFVAFWVLFYIIFIMYEGKGKKNRPSKQFEIFYWIIDDVNQWKLLAGKLSHQKVCLKKMERIHPHTHTDPFVLALSFDILYKAYIGCCHRMQAISIYWNLQACHFESRDY